MKAGTSLRRFVAPVALLLAGFAALTAVACSSEPKTTTACKPGKEIYCRCIHIEEEGTQICKEDGSGYEPCQPCLSDLPPEDAGPEPDAGSCGDGKVQAGEACDDGNKVDDDFCTNSCLPGENPKGAGNCPANGATGLAVHLWGSSIELLGNTTSYGNLAKTKAACGGTFGSTANDRVYVVVPHQTGPVTITVTKASFDSMLYARSSCGDVASELACVNDKQGSGDERLVVPGSPDTPIYVYVDGGATTAAGQFLIRFEQ